MHKFIAMKKTVLFLIAIVLIGLSSCQDPGKSRVYMDEGQKLMMRYSQYEKAEEAFTKAIKYDKNNYEALYLRGCSKVNQRKYEEAIADFEHATQLKPDYADAYFNIGIAYHLLKDEDSACVYYKLADQYGRPNMEDFLKRCP